MLSEVFLQVLDRSLTGSIVFLVVLLLRFLLLQLPRRYTCLLWMAVFFRLLCPLSLRSPVGILPELSLEQRLSLSMESPNLVFTVLPVLWLIGLVVFLLQSLTQLLCLRQQIQTRFPLEDGVFLSDHIPAPFVLGLLHPKVYLPTSLDAEVRPLVLLHERCHIRRLDHIGKLLMQLALWIHWFNPLVWLASSLTAADMEMACDEAVACTLSASARADYAAVLLSLSTGPRSPVEGLHMPLSFSGGDTGNIRHLACARSSLPVGCNHHIGSMPGAGSVSQHCACRTRRRDISFCRCRRFHRCRHFSGRR